MSIGDHAGFIGDLEVVRDALRNYLVLVTQALLSVGGDVSYDCMGAVLLRELDRCVDGLLKASAADRFASGPSH